MAQLLSVAKIIKKPTGQVFFLDANDNLLESICKTTEVRRPIENGILNSLQFTFKNGAGTDVNFETNAITYIEYKPGKSQTWGALTGSYIDPIEVATKFQEVFLYLSSFVFECCCCDGDGGPVTVHNSDNSYEVVVPCGDDLELEDYDYEIYLDGVISATGSFPSMVDVTLNITITG